MYMYIVHQGRTCDMCGVVQMKQGIFNTDNFQRGHPTLQLLYRGPMVRISLGRWGVGGNLTYSFFATRRARVGDTVPCKRSTFAHHPPVLLFPTADAHNPCLDSSETRPIVRASL